ncbi:MAG: DUF2461 domain-containing protein, partial [Magnetococcales bacterium]|nr:DUF2461 domain-containing protein [Magnetococcales bacterium]
PSHHNPRKTARIPRRDGSGPDPRAFFAEASHFLCDLRTNNTRDWFNAHRERYDRVIRHASEAFCERLLPGLEGLTGHAMQSRIFRMHRDVRFSKDKTPYHTHLHIGFSRADSGDEGSCGVGFLFGIETDRLVIGAGTLAFPNTLLAAYRTRVADETEGAYLADLLRHLTASGFRPGTIELKRPPPPFAQTHPHAELLRRKSLTALRDLTPDQVQAGGDLTELYLTQAQALFPLYRWITAVRDSAG